MQWRGISVFSLAALAMAALMLLPAALALLAGQQDVATVFAKWSVVIALGALGIALARYRMPPRRAARGEILTVIACFTLLPLLAALPLMEVLPLLTLERAYFEMVSTFTTTGMTSLDDMVPLPVAVHLWRALTAWLGGFMALTAAAAVFGPRNLGGYEVNIDQRAGTVGRLPGLPAWATAEQRQGAEYRLAIAVVAIGPAYALLTVVVALGMMVAGVPALAAVVQAIGVMSTSGLSLDDSGFQGGVPAEIVTIGFLALAATRHPFGRGAPMARLRRLRGDPEIELALFTIGVAAAWIVLRGLADLPRMGLPGEAVWRWLEAGWAAVFTATSFLSTTGYVSALWEPTHAAAGLSPPGMLLLALAAMGGGVASTAGGVKLLRSFALFQHGLSEMYQLSHPSAIPPRGKGLYRVGFSGAVLAWLFLMLFLLAVGLGALALSLQGVGLDASLAASIAASTNTGPVYAVATGADMVPLSSFTPAARLSLCAGMIVGRVEVLAVVALTNPAYWRHR